MSYQNERPYLDGMFPQRDTYVQRDHRVEYQLYNQDYFSGADIHIYFGDIWIDEITSLEFRLEEQLLPIFGYHSYTFDAVARGTRQIVGAFSMNFKSVGYLQQVIEHADAIQYALNNPKAEKVTLDRLQDYKLDDILKIYGKESFDQIAQEYEDAIWGVEDSEEDDIYTDHSSPFFQSDQPFGFDIRINYGPARESNKKRHMYEEEKIKLPRQTVEIINGIQLTGLSKQFATANQGMPIQEAYTFMARDINGKPSR